MNQFIFRGLLLAAGILLFNACAKNTETDLSDAQDEMQLMLMDRDAVPVLPDLRIVSLTSSLPVNDTPCGPNLSDATCGGPFGQVDFQFTIIYENRSPVAVPPGAGYDVEVCIAGGACTGPFVTTGIPGYGRDTITTAVSSFACPQGNGPYNYVTETFFAIVDQLDDIDELNENNNFSDRFFICTETD